MAGTYVSAMYSFINKLKEECDEWERWLDEACSDGKDSTPQQLLGTKWLPDRNPVFHIAFTNYYKFLLVAAGEATGGKVQLDWKCEQRFLVAEATALEPDAILLQSAEFRNYHGLLNDLSKIADVLVGYHPAARGDKRKLKNLLESIIPWPKGGH